MEKVVLSANTQVGWMFQLALLLKVQLLENRVMTKNQMNRIQQKNHLLIVLIYVVIFLR